MKILFTFLLSIFIMENLFAEAPKGVIYQPENKEEKFWIPSKESIEKIEISFSKFLQERLNRFAKNRKIQEVPPQNEYVRQYFGTYLNGKKVLMIRGHRNSNPDLEKLKKELYMILDGSWYLFTAYYDPESFELSNFSFNDGSDE